MRARPPLHRSSLQRRHTVRQKKYLSVIRPLKVPARLSPRDPVVRLRQATALNSSSRRLRYLILHPHLPKTQTRPAPAFSSRRPTARQRPAHPRCLPQTRRKSFWGMGGSLRGEGPFELWPKGSSPATKYPAHFPLPCSSSCSQRASRSAASTERGPGRANRCSSTSSTRPERTALRPR